MASIARTQATDDMLLLFIALISCFTAWEWRRT